MDSNGTLWVADNWNHRVLRFASAANKLDGANADGVLGQADFTSNAANRGGITAANTLWYPFGVAVDNNGTLWVVDASNNRVLGYSHSTNANLSNLVLSGGTFTPTFAAATTNYTATVPYTVTSLTVTPTVSDTSATVTVNGTPVTSGSASGNLTLTVGVNVIATVVTAADGSSSKSYLVSVTRAGVADVALTQSYNLVKGTNTTAQPSSLAALANTLTLTITVRNNGPDAVAGVVIADTFPTAVVSTTWTWTCVGAGGGVCGTTSGTGNLNQTLGVLPKDGSVTFVVTGALLNPNNWRNTPLVTTPTGVVDTNTTNNSVTVGTFVTFMPLVKK